MKKADTLDELARVCGIDAAGLTATVERFNASARSGIDPDFHRGEGAHEQYQGDVTHAPNASVGPVDKPPYYAVAIFPGDVGTSGGMLCDEFSRVLNADHQPIPGLYATGNCTASVMGALPAILPVNYAVVDDAIVFRSDTGSKFSAAMVLKVIRPSRRRRSSCGAGGDPTRARTGALGAAHRCCPTPRGRRAPSDDGG